jgi:hypothetical protein
MAQTISLNLFAARPDTRRGAMLSSDVTGCTLWFAMVSLTGFRVRTEKRIVTALHGILDCNMIRAKTDYGESLTEQLSLSRYDVEADAASLISDELQRKPLVGIDANSTPPVDGSRALVLGHPFSTSYHVTEVIIRRR